MCIRDRPDVVYTSDVCHHMDDDELVTFLREQYERCQSAVIVLDLQRSTLASWLFLVPGFLLCNWLARYDGYTSIEKAFTRDELVAAARAAGVESDNISISWVWPFRWLMTLRKSSANPTAKKQQ